MQFTDQMGRTIRLEKKPERIVSLVPSQTELLHDLGLENEVAGITKFCIHPDSWFRAKSRIGGTKQLDLEKIAALEPDLIIGNKEENEREQIELLMEKYPVWMSDICSSEDALGMIRGIGLLTGKEKEAGALADEIARRFADLETELEGTKPQRVAYFIWKNPWMVAAGGTFIDEMLRRCKWENVFSSLPGRYPEVTLSELAEAAPEKVLLSSEPYPFREKHIAEIKAVLPTAEVLTADGEMFSWYGSRLLQAPAYFRSLCKA